MSRVVAVACVVVDMPNLFKWIGPKTVLSWTMDRLEHVRGVDEVVCVASTALRDQAVSACAAADIPVHNALKRTVTEVPGVPCPDLHLLHWLCAEGPAAKASFALLLRPVLPFLSAARMEECLESVRDAKYDAAMTVAPAVSAAVDDRTGLRLGQKVAARVDGVLAAKARVIRAALPRWPSRWKGVEVGLRESLSAATDEGLTVIQAVADAGES